MKFVLVVEFHASSRGGRLAAVEKVMGVQNKDRAELTVKGDRAFVTYTFKRRGWADNAAAKLNEMHGITAMVLGLAPMAENDTAQDSEAPALVAAAS